MKNKIISSENAKFEVSLKFFIKNKKKEILLLEMPENSSMAGFYDFPGGRIRESEKDLQFSKIIRRELLEELGKKILCKIKDIPVAISRHTYISKITKQKQYILWIFFEAEFNGGEIALSDEHKNYVWVDLNKKNYKKYFVRGPLEGAAHYLIKKMA
ncbi:MAG: hypothetical protein UV40_C0029G0005 [Parcubacteria group bacterium GW2011_GWA1_42_7]|nr:MAG: hypothetical protein UV34_C0027G0006 [Parcubacteria group bacterium GW2011_GWB1_42_6]KKS69245.1 MAG: hypothetical protein UV40_C0029G0005 [Parcubacteria group bacterium GW2011_GWA1_42_7]